jgi:hypothetical protein
MEFHQERCSLQCRYHCNIASRVSWCWDRMFCGGWILENWAFIARHSDSKELSIYTGWGNWIQYDGVTHWVGQKGFGRSEGKLFRSKFLCHGLGQKKKDSLCFSSMICNEVESLNMDNSRWFPSFDIWWGNWWLSKFPAQTGLADSHKEAEIFLGKFYHWLL